MGAYFGCLLVFFGLVLHSCYGTERLERIAVALEKQTAQCKP